MSNEDTNVVVRCRGVARTFGEGQSAVVAVHDVGCDVPVGASIAILGRSGSGKSTLLQLMAGIDRPTRGEVTWPALGDRDELRPRFIGVVFQQASLLAPLDSTENVAFPLLLAGHDAASARAAAQAALSRLNLDDIAEKLPEELSGGQAQRVAIARALVTRPRFVLADEPTGQLDHASATKVLDALLGAVRETGASVVIATHDRGIAQHLDRAWTMVDGRLMLDQPVSVPA
jgi:ABC-type lipoprotein export system ATPase subunit